MADAVIVADRKIDVQKYEKSEQDQSVYLEKIHTAVAKIMNSSM